MSCCLRAQACVTAALILASCTINSPVTPPSPRVPSLSPWPATERVLSIDFSPRAASRRIASLHRLLELPAAGAKRASTLSAKAAAMPASELRRITEVPAPLERALRSELGRAVALAEPSPLLIDTLPSADRLAATTARDLERLGFLIGLERRPLGEIDDRRHRTDPHDDRPERTLWQRLYRRIFP